MEVQLRSLVLILCLLQFVIRVAGNHVQPRQRQTIRAANIVRARIPSRRVVGVQRQINPIINNMRFLRRPSVVRGILPPRQQQNRNLSGRQYLNSDRTVRRMPLRGSSWQQRQQPQMSLHHNVPILRRRIPLSDMRHDLHTILRGQVGTGIYGPEQRQQSSALPTETRTGYVNPVSVRKTDGVPPFRTRLPAVGNQRPIFTHRQDDVQTIRRKPHQQSVVILNEQEPTTISSIVANNQVQQNATSLLAFLNSRRPNTRNEKDEQMLRNHLTTLDSMRDEDRNKTRVLLKQMRYVKEIEVFNIQREVLKLLVKDIIEKSGIMNNDTRRADIRTLVNLITMVNRITAEFVNPGKSTLPTVIEQTTLRTPVMRSPEERQRDRQNVRNRIANALNVFRTPGAQNTFSKTKLNREILTANVNNNEKVPQSPLSKQNENTSSMNGTKSVLNIRRPLLREVGMSIYGEPSTIQDQPALVPLETIPIPVINRVTEPFGGDLGYWTHLSAGIADMLCNLCRQQTLAACIQRFCTDDRAGTTAVP